jgi:hypothetical protein
MAGIPRHFQDLLNPLKDVVGVQDLCDGCMGPEDRRAWKRQLIMAPKFDDASAVFVWSRQKNVVPVFKIMESQNLVLIFFALSRSANAPKLPVCTLLSIPWALTRD